MKKTLRKYFALFSFLVSISSIGSVWGQVNYSANFDAGAQSWTGFNNFTGATACGGSGGAMRYNLYSFATSATFTSPSLGTATGSPVLLTYDYKVANWSANNVGTTNPWGNFYVQYSASAAGPWTTIAGSTVDQTNHTVSANCANKSLSFTPPAGALFVRFVAAWSAGDYYLNFDNINVIEIQTPPTPTQAAGTPTCSGGTTLDVVGSPQANTTWYWQTSATGTSTATPYAGPYTVYANGTYYLRGYNTTYSVWSDASSVTVSNFPSAATPGAPIAAANPACMNTDLTSPTAPAGTDLYWQTVPNGSSMSMPATAPWNVTSTGTYYLAAYETATGCWSPTSSLAVSIGTVIPPAPGANPTFYNYCSDAATMPVTAQVPVLMGSYNCSNSASASGTDNTSVTATVSDFSCAASGTVTAASLNATIGTNCTAWYYYSIWVNGVEVATQQCNQNNFNLTPYLPLTSVAIVSHDNPLDGIGDFVNMNLTVNLTYSAPNPVQPAYGITWYDAATAGTSVGTGSTINGLGTSVLPTAVAGTYDFFAETTLDGCSSTARTEVNVNVTEVLATLNPVNVTCNGNNTGSFTLGTVQCGSGNFLYSVDGVLPYGPIPTNLLAGTHTVTIQDQVSMDISSPITLVITEPGAPTALTVDDVNYFTADVSWTASGDETSWVVEWGPVGFTQGSGIGTVTVSSENATLTGLDPDTDYEFYVQAGCAAGSAWAGPQVLTTNTGFFTWDTQCGPGFTDISATGAGLDLADDATTVITTVNPISVQGASSNTITISNNGWISFAGITLNAWQVDLDSEEGNVYWEETTIGGDDYFIVQWDNRPRFSGVIGQNVTFQILFNQTTSEFYYVYEDVVFGGTQSYSDYADDGFISVQGPTSITVSNYDPTFLQNNTCAHFYYSLCPNITNFDALIYPDEINLTWDAGMYGETDWTVVYGYAGFDPTVSGEELGSFPYSTNYAQLTGLTQNTEYDIYIYSECMADNLTSDGYFFNFITLPYCSNPSTITVGTDVDSLEVAWNWAEYDPAYPINHFNIMYEMDGVYSNEVVADGVNFADTVVDPMLIGSGVYQVYVQAVCDNAAMTEDTSAWVGPITVVMPLSNDTVCGAEMLEMDYVYTLNNAGATVSVDEVNIAPPATGAQETDGWANSTLNNTVWYRFVAPPSGSVRINNTAIAYNGQLAVYDVADCGDFNANFTLVAANDNEIDGTSLAPNFTICGLTPGSTYYVLHDGTGTTGNYSISISEIVLEAGSALPLTQICYGEILDLNTTISGNDAGGVWSAPVAAVNASITGSDFNSNGLAYQTFDFQYRMTDGCAYDSIVSQVQIFAPSSAGTDGSITICKNEPVNLFNGLSGTVDLGGEWLDPSNDPTPSDIVGSPFPGSFNYDYITGNGVCPDDTSTVLVIVLSSCDENSIDEAAFAGVQLYPNPTSGIINIDADKTFNVEVTDANGRMIKKDISTTVGTTSVDLGKVQVGVYFVTLRTEDASKVYRVVVQ
jgi:hypothetical protein